MVEVDARYEIERLRHTRRGRETLAPLVDQIVRQLRTGNPPTSPQRAALTVALAGIGQEVVADVGAKVTEALGGEISTRAAWSPDGTVNYIAKIAEGMALGTLDDVFEMTFDVPADELETVLAAIRQHLGSLAEDMTDTAVNFAVEDAAERAGAQKKRWRANTSRHAGMAGITIPMDAAFPNGLSRPRGGGPPSETANCKCSLVVIKEDA